MGDPAELSAIDRALLRSLAFAIVDDVTYDASTPLATLRTYAQRYNIPEDTFMLWFAQEMTRNG